ncbi:MAG: NAD(+) diphosphatase [Anaerolineales bacterium]|nr:NAD(+) diphosphatase [Anaerolineales bacterium]MCB0012696.1 NAD(+) diphosphatase [Anaerolineales bacterium]MCB0031595.1 NAD(+) diphosphatase [Anaerolineales bacterium]MCB8959622.1 NAD(+) diphosphatase [Ardenticatenales bacterium]
MNEFIDAPLKFVAGYEPDQEEGTVGLWFIFRGYQILVFEKNELFALPQVIALSEIGLQSLRSFYLGSLDGQPCFVAELDDLVEAPAGMQFRNLRSLYSAFPEKLFWIAGRAQHFLDWDRYHQYCGRCGTPTVRARNDWNKQCPKCELSHYPRLSPAIIVLVERGDEILLARANRYQGAMYSVLAGFVEPGESLEDTLHREIFEEVGIKVKNVRYFGSQPWPFPNSLMVGFTCEYESGELVLQEEEIADAQWFTADNMPEIPPGISISRRLINWYLDKHRQQ